MCIVRIALAVIFPAACLILERPSIYAAPKTWDGGSVVDSLLTTPENWDADTAFVGGDALTFTGLTRLDPTTAAGLPSPRSVLFDASAGAFVIGGTEEFVINNAGASSANFLTNSSGSTQVFNAPVAVRRTTLNADTGDFVFNGAFRTYSNFSTYAGAKDYYFNGGITGASQIYKTGTGTMYIPTDNSSRQATGTSSATAANFGIAGGIAEISHNHALGGGNSDGTQGYIQFSNGLNGAIGTIALTNKNPLGVVTGNISVGQFVYLYGSSDATPHFSNKSGNNVLTGNMLDDGGGADAAQHTISSDGTESGDFFTLTGNIEKSLSDATRPAGVLTFRGAGDGLWSGNLIESGTGSWAQLVKAGTGTWTLTGSLNHTGTTSVDEGTLALGTTGNFPSATQIQIKTDGVLDVTGQPSFTVGISTAQTLKGDGAVTGNVTIAPGSTLAVDYMGGSIDSLAISGDLTITGATLDFNDVGGALIGGPHVFATYGSLIGDAFGSVIDLPAGFKIDYHYLGNQIALVPHVAGDFDGDGDVDGADFVVWQTNFPTSSGAGTGQGDADGDADVDGADFAAWQNSFPNPAPGTSPVPEPAGLIALTLGGVVFLLGKRWGSVARSTNA